MCSGQCGIHPCTYVLLLCTFVCVTVGRGEAVCPCCGSHHRGLRQWRNTKCSVSWEVTGAQQETWHGVSSENSFHSVLFSRYFSVALSLNHQQKIKAIIVMNTLTGLCNSGWIYEHFYNNSTVVWGNPTVWLRAEDYENHFVRMQAYMYVSFLKLFLSDDNAISWCF